MVCKEDVLSWFKELESYKRIDLMCSLLNMCLPFELRFVGTYVEELGKRDFQELRGAELRANNADELAADVSAAKGDPRAPRKMALYVSLLRSCNAACAAQLHAVLVALEPRKAERDELLLLYCMALHHPAFTFHQREHFGDILARLQQRQGAPVSEVDEMANSVVPANNPQPMVEPIAPGIPEGLPPPAAYPQYNIVDYGMHGHWSEGMVMHEMIPQEVYPMYQANPSPTISQRSSPCDSRPVSPNIQIPPPPLIPGSRIALQQTQDTVSMPPPPHDPHQLQHQLIMTNFSLNNMNLNDIHQMDDERLHEMGMPPNAVVQLRSLEKCNGMQRASHGNNPAQSYLYTLHSRHERSSGSNSGNSSVGSHSPPETPVLSLPPGIPPGQLRQTSSPHYQYAQYQRTPFANLPPAYRHNLATFAANGEASLYGGQYPAPYVSVPVYAAPKLSCWNCGSIGHTGSDCKEPSIEEVTRPGGYQLDYSTAPPDINDK